jgi:heptosyltransferase I
VTRPATLYKPNGMRFPDLFVPGRSASLRQCFVLHRARDTCDFGNGDMPLAADPMADILFIKTSSLGDVIHHLPALTDAARAKPEARFAWVVEEAFAPLARLHAAAHEVIPVASRRWRRALAEPKTIREILAFRRDLRRHAYTQVIDTQGLLRTGLMTWFARGRRHGYDRNSIREPAAAWFYDVRHTVARDQHAIARNRALTALALGYAPAGPIDYGLDRAALAVPAAPAAAPRQALLLHATARANKEWPEAHWVELGGALAARGLVPILSYGSDAERVRAERLATRIPGAQVPARRPLDAVARLIAGCSVVVGVDTGLLHLAAALAVPLAAIFVGSEPGLTGPLGNGPIAVTGGKGLCPPVAEVLAAVDGLAASAVDGPARS